MKNGDYYWIHYPGGEWEPGRYADYGSPSTRGFYVANVDEFVELSRVHVGNHIPFPKEPPR